MANQHTAKRCHIFKLRESLKVQNLGIFKARDFGEESLAWETSAFSACKKMPVYLIETCKISRQNRAMLRFCFTVFLSIKVQRNQSVMTLCIFFSLLSTFKRKNFCIKWWRSVFFTKKSSDIYLEVKLLWDFFPERYKVTKEEKVAKKWSAWKK